MPVLKNVPVENKARTGKAIQVAGEWYGSFTAAPLSEIERGHYVDIEYTETKKGEVTYKNIKKVNKVATPSLATGTTVSISTSPPAPTYSSRAKEFPLPPLHPDRSIVRQNCVGNAVRFIGESTDYHIDGDTMSPVEAAETAAHVIILLARELEAYCCGDLDREEAEKAVVAFGSAEIAD